MHNVHTHERGREEFLIDSLKPLNLCRKALERLDGDEEEGQMWDAYVIGGDDFGSVAFSCLFPLSQGITLAYSLRFCTLQYST